MNGWCVHKDVFKFMRRFNTKFILDDLYMIVQARIELAKSHFANMDIQRTRRVSGGTKLINQIDRSFDSFEMRNTKEVAINPDYITLLRKVMVTKSSGFTFRFNERTGGILVTPNKSNIKEHAMITPLIVTGDLC